MLHFQNICNSVYKQVDKQTRKNYTPVHVEYVLHNNSASNTSKPTFSGVLAHTHAQTQLLTQKPTAQTILLVQPSCPFACRSNTHKPLNLEKNMKSSSSTHGHFLISTGRPAAIHPSHPARMCTKSTYSLLRLCSAVTERPPALHATISGSAMLGKAASTWDWN